MAQTELKNIERKVGMTGDNRCGCGATMITGTDLFVDDWVAVSNPSALTTAVLDYAHASGATVVDWEGFSADHSIEAKLLGRLFYGNFSQIRLTAGALIAYKRCK